MSLAGAALAEAARPPVQQSRLPAHVSAALCQPPIPKPAFALPRWPPDPHRCQNLSLKDNIVFGQPYDQDKYERVLHACALELDLQILMDGDETKAGLRGINLSGGQRQRLNLARAAYFDGDLVLLVRVCSCERQLGGVCTLPAPLPPLPGCSPPPWAAHLLPSPRFPSPAG